MEALITPCNKVSCNSWATRMRSARRSSKRSLSVLVTRKSHTPYSANIAAAAASTQTNGNHQLCQIGGQPCVIATAATPWVGSKAVVQGGWNPGSTSSAAYWPPGWVELRHVEFD